MAKKVLGMQEEEFVRYASCPACSTLYYLVEQCQLQLPDKSRKCNHVEFSLHPHRIRRQPCNTVLMKAVKASAGTVVLSPRNLYCYQKLTQKLLKQPDFLSMCELWRS